MNFPLGLILHIIAGQGLSSAIASAILNGRRFPKACRSSSSSSQFDICRPFSAPTPHLSHGSVSIYPYPYHFHRTLHLPHTNYLNSSLPSTLTRKKPRYLMAAFRSSHTRFPMLVPLARQDTRYACTPSSTHFHRPLPGARRKRDTYRTHFWFVSSPFFSF